LLVERFDCRPVKPNHFECYDRTPVPLLKARFLVRHSQLLPLLPGNHCSICAHILKKQRNQDHSSIRTAFELARRLATAVRSARTAGHFPLVLSGNCNTAVGTLSGLTPARRATFWFDANGDGNTPETTTTGFLVKRDGRFALLQRNRPET
jgi:hypothetical protein